MHATWWGRGSSAYYVASDLSYEKEGAGERCAGKVYWTSKELRAYAFFLVEDNSTPSNRCQFLLGSSFNSSSADQLDHLMALKHRAALKADRACVNSSANLSLQHVVAMAAIEYYRRDCNLEIRVQLTMQPLDRRPSPPGLRSSYRISVFFLDRFATCDPDVSRVCLRIPRGLSGVYVVSRFK